MNLSLYSASTGMEAQQLNLSTIANNIANVNTTGFKRSKVEFQDLLYQKPKMVGGNSGNGNVVPVGVELGNGSRVVSTARVFTQGQLNETGEKFDLAIQGDGFLEVQMPDGTLAYTRDGALKVDANGQIVTADGLPVNSGFQAVPVGTEEVYISPNGEVTYKTADATTNFRINLFRFNNPAGLKSMGNNLYQPTDGSGTAEQGNPQEGGFGSIRQGFLEMSNVSVVQEMVNMIVSQRAYEINSRSIQASDEMLQTVNQLKR